MTGVAVPEDRTLMQPVVAYCSNPQCRDVAHKEFTFIVEHDHFACPKCGADQSPAVGLLVLTHLLVQHPRGPVIGSGGTRYVIACDDKRAYLATVSNLEAATGNAKVANCPGCLQRAEALELVQKRVFIVPGRDSSDSSNSPDPDPDEDSPDEAP